MISDWFGTESEETYDYFPNLAIDISLKNYIWINTIYIFDCHKEGFAYFGFCGNCKWDEEHGFGAQIHKAQVIFLGDEEIGFSNWECLKDAGQMEDYEMKYKIKREKEPQKYDASTTKYGKLNPFQVEENDRFILNLIDRNYIDKLKNLVENNELDINSVYSDYSILEWAANREKYELMNYLVEKGAKVKIPPSIFNFRYNFEYLKLLADKGIISVNHSIDNKTMLQNAQSYLESIENNMQLSEEQKIEYLSRVKN